MKIDTDFDVSNSGLRIGYLYDHSTKEEQCAIDKILDKYNGDFPLILRGLNAEPILSIAEAKKAQALFDGIK